MKEDTKDRLQVIGIVLISIIVTWVLGCGGAKLLEPKECPEGEYLYECGWYMLYQKECRPLCHYEYNTTWIIKDGREIKHEERWEVCEK